MDAMATIRPRRITGRDEKMNKETPARASEADTRHGPLGILLAQARAKKNTIGPAGPIFFTGCFAAEGRNLRRRSGGG